jgi:hypothetical protein
METAEGWTPYAYGIVMTKWYSQLPSPKLYKRNSAESTEFLPLTRTAVTKVVA